MKKVLIVGSSGTLGQALVEEFKKGDYDVTSWDREDIDVTSQDASGKISALGPDIIINATAYNAVDKAETDEAERKICFAINAEAPKILAEAAKKIGAVFVHYSTNYVFKGDKKEGYSEEDIPEPVNKYGESKLEGEEAVKEAGGKYYILRLARLFGVRGVSPMSKRTFVEIMLSEVDKSELEVGNTEVSNITYALDAAKLTREIVEKNLPFGIYHATNEGAITWFDWATEIFKALGRGPKVLPAGKSLTPKVSKHPELSGLINTKLPPQRNWREVTDEFVKTLAR